MREERQSWVSRALGPALILLVMLGLEAPWGLDEWAARLAMGGFLVFGSRILLRTRRVGLRLAVAPPWAWWVLAGILALTGGIVGFALANLALVALMLVGGILTAELLGDVARAGSRAVPRRWPGSLASGWAALAVLALLAFGMQRLAHVALLRLDDGDPVAGGAMGLSLGLIAAALAWIGLLAWAARGRGRRALGRRLAFTLLAAASLGAVAGYLLYAVTDALNGEPPLFGGALFVVEFARLLIEAPEEMAERRVIPRAALPDALLAASFATIVVIQGAWRAGLPQESLVALAEAYAWFGLLVGIFLVFFRPRKPAWEQQEA